MEPSELPDFDALAHGAELKPGTEVDGYRVLKKLGAGAMGAVYLVEDPHLAKRFALKVLAPALAADPAAVRRFFIEARAASQIEHQNIIGVFRLGQLPDGRHYLVMEYLDGESLADRLARGPLTWSERTRFTRQILDALTATHAARVTHRDLKPDNIWIAHPKHDEVRIKLLDFGIAKLARDQGVTPKLTSTGVGMGTPAYMAPEQWSGKDVGPPADVYAVGVLLFEIFTGQLPFSPADPFQQAARQSASPAPLASAFASVPPEIDALIACCLEREAASRPSAADLRERLSAAFAQYPDGVPARPVAATLLVPAAISRPREEVRGSTQPPPRDHRTSTLGAAAGETIGAIPRQPWPKVATLAIVVVAVAVSGAAILHGRRARRLAPSAPAGAATAGAPAPTAFASPPSPIPLPSAAIAAPPVATAPAAATPGVGQTITAATATTRGSPASRKPAARAGEPRRSRQAGGAGPPTAAPPREAVAPAPPVEGDAPFRPDQVNFAGPR